MISQFIGRINLSKVRRAAEPLSEGLPELFTQLGEFEEEQRQEKRRADDGQQQAQPRCVFEDEGRDGEERQGHRHKDREQEGDVGPTLLSALALAHVLGVVDAHEEEGGEDTQEAAVENLGDFGDSLARNCKENISRGNKSSKLLTAGTNPQSTEDSYGDLNLGAHANLSLIVLVSSSRRPGVPQCLVLPP